MTIFTFHLSLGVDCNLVQFGAMFPFLRQYHVVSFCEKLVQLSFHIQCNFETLYVNASFPCIILDIVNGCTVYKLLLSMVFGCLSFP